MIAIKARDQSWKEVERWVQCIVSRFIAKKQPLVPFHLDFDELMSVAGAAYIRACQLYNPDKSAFTTWVGLVVNTHLTRALRSNFRDCCPPERISNRDVDRVPDRSWNVGRLLFELSDDAATAVRIALEEGCRRNLPYQLRKLGWPEQKILRVINEIKEALQ